MSGELQQIIGDGLAAQHGGPAHANAFAKGDDQQFRLHALLTGATATVLTHHANTVGIIHQQPGVLLFRNVR